MKYNLKIKDVQTINAIGGYWSDADYVNLLGDLNYADAAGSNPAELRELLEMAISDFEPHEAAEILLRYRLKDTLNAGQINNISHEMTEDNESEGNANTAIHYTLFNINQLLRKAYNGTFPDAKATKMVIELSFEDDVETELCKERALKAICKSLSKDSPLIRVFEDQLNGKEAFRDAGNAIWELHSNGNNEYVIITSNYWINEEDINEYELSGSIKEFED